MINRVDDKRKCDLFHTFAEFLDDQSSEHAVNGEAAAELEEKQRKQNTIIITGKREKCEAAKAALLVSNL